MTDKEDDDDGITFESMGQDCFSQRGYVFIGGGGRETRAMVASTVPTPIASASATNMLVKLEFVPLVQFFKQLMATAVLSESDDGFGKPLVLFIAIRQIKLLQM